MHKPRAVRLNALGRIRLLAEQRAEIAVEQASVALLDANEELRQANDRVEKLAAWKAEISFSADAWIGVYEQGLLAEQHLVSSAEEAACVSGLAEVEHRGQTASLLQASRNVKVVERRSKRERHLQMELRERSLADVAADMWVYRRMYADR